MDYVILENGESGVFGNIKRKGIVCSFRSASVFLRSAVDVTNLLLTKNLVADLQESLSKDILSFSERFPKVQ